MQRFAGPDSDSPKAGDPDGTRVMARAAGVLFLCGATIGAISVALPHAAGANDTGLLGNIMLAYVGAAAMLLFGHRLPRWCFHVVMVAGTLLITRAVYLSDDPGSFYAAWYVWVGLFVFFFFNRAQALAHLAVIAAAYAAVLAHDPGTSGAGRWLTTVTTLLVAGAFTSVLVRRVRLQAADAARSAQNLSAVAEVARQLSGEDVDATRQAICRAALTITGGSCATLWEPTPQGSGLTVSAAVGRPPREDVVHFVAGRSGPTRVYASGEPLFVADLEAQAELARTGVAPETRACLWQPVLRNGAPIAVLAVGWSEPVAGLSDNVAAVLELLAGEATAAMDRADLLSRLKSVARTDDLTGLPNRRAWDEELPRELARADRDGGPLSVAMLDLDSFKHYNDERGHQAGDRLLKQTAAAWSGRIRVIDVLARYGGDEFVLALPGCALDDARTLVDDLRSATPGGLTFSAGVTSWDRSEDAEGLLGRADRALYSAKRAGGDRTAGAATEPVTAPDRPSRWR